MCGLLGCIGNTVLNEEFKIKFTKIFTDIEYRGKDGTGIYIPNKIVKGNTPVSEFVKAKEYHDIFDGTTVPFILGHVRKATTGSTDVTEKEAHPFYSNHTVLIHNGTIESTAETFTKEEIQKFGVDPAVNVDSVFISLLYEKYGEQFLDHLKGIATFFLHDIKKNSIYLYVDSERDLYHGVENGNLWFCSVGVDLEKVLPLTKLSLFGEAKKRAEKVESGYLFKIPVMRPQTTKVIIKKILPRIYKPVSLPSYQGYNEKYSTYPQRAVIPSTAVINSSKPKEKTTVRTRTVFASSLYVCQKCLPLVPQALIDSNKNENSKIICNLCQTHEATNVLRLIDGNHEPYLEIQKYESNSDINALESFAKSVIHNIRLDNIKILQFNNYYIFVAKTYVYGKYNLFITSTDYTATTLKDLTEEIQLLEDELITSDNILTRHNHFIFRSSGQDLNDYTKKTLTAYAAFELHGAPILVDIIQKLDEIALNLIWDTKNEDLA